MHNYHDVNNTLPYGIKGCCYGTWLVPTLPYVEQQNLFNSWNSLGNSFGGFGGPLDGPLRYGGATNFTVTTSRVAAFMCPSDSGTENLTGLGPTIGGVKYFITSQNYVINFGNTTQTQPPVFQGVPFGGAPFTDIGSPDSLFTGLYTTVENRKTTYNFSTIRDGLSNTMLVSELIVPQGQDLRGFSWWGLGSSYTAWQTPNSNLPDITINPGYCRYPMGDNPPCQVASTALPMMLAARSRHPGGVDVAFADGSVKFIKNSINVFTWRALASTRGGEVISSDAY